MSLNIVTFYTKRYQPFAKGWCASIQARGHCAIAEKITAESWRRAVAMKPSFILRMIDKTGGPVIWLDVDGKMKSQPVLLERAHESYDVAGWVWKEPEHMLTGTLWFNDSQGAREVLRGWAELEATATERGSGQPNLWKTILRLNPRLLRLPQAYTQISGLSWRDDVRPVVFEHICASLSPKYGDETTVPYLARKKKRLQLSLNERAKLKLKQRKERLQEHEQQKQQRKPEEAMSVLACGPFGGEFGYELMTWQAHCRRLSDRFAKTIVGCRMSSVPLYADFASEFRVVPSSVETCCARTKADMRSVQHALQAIGAKGPNKWIPARAIGGGRFIKYGTASPEWADVVALHARDTPKTEFGRSSLLRNWPGENWDELLSRFPDVRFVAIGLHGESSCPQGALDMRGRDLQVVMDLLASCRLLIGPQSGPIHLAALCGCPHLVWTKPDQGPRGMLNGDRLRKTWNPLKTPVTIVDGFDAPVDSVETELRKLLKDEPA